MVGNDIFVFEIAILIEKNIAESEALFNYSELTANCCPFLSSFEKDSNI